MPSLRLSLNTVGHPVQVLQSTLALVRPVRLQKLTIQPIHLLVSIHASLKLYIASDHTPLSFSLFERGPLCTTARQLVHALAMHYAAGALFRAGTCPVTPVTYTYTHKVQRHCAVPGSMAGTHTHSQTHESFSGHELLLTACRGSLCVLRRPASASAHGPTYGRHFHIRNHLSAADRRFLAAVSR